MHDLNLMAVFAHVAQEQSFSTAARKLGMSRSAVSKAVAKLESALGARLLNRSTRHLSLTEVGAAMLEHCARIVAESERASQVVENLNSKPSGTLRVAASVAFGTLHVAPAMADFLQQYPEVELDMTITDRQIDLAEEGYDVIVKVTQEPPPALVARKLAAVRRQICGTAAYFAQHGLPTSPMALTAHNCLDYTHSGDKGWWRFKGPEGDIAVPVSGRVRINDDEALSQVVLGGFGLALLPTFIIGNHLQSGHLQSVLSEYIPVEQHVYAMYLPNRHLPLKARTFIDFLLARFSPEPYWDAL
ncbi:LysR family transcriptional regulator [Methylovorus menthalis]|uniref:LysR family transcriptional regulator n=1 Tax=Methylovorus menthalis TaxID=1002227 RepID=UPI001E4CCD53|nr:LysR family transcriptional regulator [Methylovorus menthalis]MCB4809974.1 LysR family transcriptional regulator [Methylovorus menthalis]